MLINVVAAPCGARAEHRTPHGATMNRAPDRSRTIRFCVALLDQIFNLPQEARIKNALRQDGSNDVDV